MKTADVVFCFNPQFIVDTATLFMCSIDLDPASSEIANSIINATEIFTLEYDGLSKSWYGNVCQWARGSYRQLYYYSTITGLKKEIDLIVFFMPEILRSFRAGYGNFSIFTSP